MSLWWYAREDRLSFERTSAINIIPSPENMTFGGLARVLEEPAQFAGNGERRWDNAQKNEVKKCTWLHDAVSAWFACETPPTCPDDSDPLVTLGIGPGFEGSISGIHVGDLNEQVLRRLEQSGLKPRVPRGEPRAMWEKPKPQPTWNWEVDLQAPWQLRWNSRDGRVPGGILVDKSVNVR